MNIFLIPNEYIPDPELIFYIMHVLLYLIGFFLENFQIDQTKNQIAL